MDHVHEHDHRHPHGHDHGHDHDHGLGDYYLEQLLGIFISGLFGAVAVLLYVLPAGGPAPEGPPKNRLSIMLAPEFHELVLVGGVVLLAFTAVRAVSVWVQAGKHSHDHHDHGEDCGHGCGHDHGHGDHGHSHGNWVYLQTIVLSFPLLLFFIGIPNQGFSKEWVNQRLGQDVALGAVKDIEAKGGDVIGYDFAQLAAAALDPDKRAVVEGRTVSIRGQFRPVGEKEFTLYKLKMNCCAADMIPLKARIVTSFVPFGFNDGDWVQATGPVQFVEIPGKNQYVPVIRVKDEKGVQKTTPES
jgi:hypothetical protein